jgi:hypothetical protein
MIICSRRWLTNEAYDLRSRLDTTPLVLLLVVSHWTLFIYPCGHEFSDSAHLVYYVFPSTIPELFKPHVHVHQPPIFPFPFVTFFKFPPFRTKPLLLQPERNTL